MSKENITVDKDHYMNKRLKLSGDLLGELFRVNLRALVQDMLFNFQRLVKRGKFQSIKIIIREKLLTSRIKSAMATGVWVGGRKGVSQNIDRTNNMATISNLQRVVSLLTSSQENFEARALHSTHFGRLCLAKETNVLLADKSTIRTLEQLQNCWKHHKLITYNTESQKFIPSKIVSYFSSNPKLMKKSVLELTSESGRQIIATEDHPLLTPNGWIDAGKLNTGDLVAVYPMLDTVKTPNPPSVEEGEIIVDESKIKEIFPNRYKHYIKELKEKELLPFSVNNYWVEIISRLQGHLFTDGHCGKYNLEFYCGSLDDAEEIANDIRNLGFTPSKINKKVSRAFIRNREITNTTYRLTKGGALHALLVALGTPVGRKTDSNYRIPEWLWNAELSVKREFLSAYMGGDGGKPRYLDKVKIEDLFFHKNIKLRDGGLKFAKELSVMFKLFDVVVKRIYGGGGYRRQDGSQTMKIELIFSKSKKNMKNLITKIGFRYCKSKSAPSLYLGEWLRIHEKIIDNKIQLKRTIRSMYRDGATPKQVAKSLDISYRFVNNCLFERKYEKTSTVGTGLLPFNTWLINATQSLEENGLVWERIDDRKNVNINDVRDLTTLENTHTFVANGFITHNCPIETPEGTPIGLRKNLSILCSITQEEYNEEKLKKMLEGYGLKGVG